jgi:serine/threonine-protein kinase
MPEAREPETAPMTPVSGDAPTIAVTRSDAAETTGSGPSRLEAMMAEEERHAFRHRMIRALWLSVIGWLAFLASDALMIWGLGHAGPVTLLARIGPALGLIVLLVIARRVDLGAGLLRVMEVCTFATGMISIGILAALHEKGITSSHVPGSVLVLLSYGVTLGSHWRRSLLPVVVTTLALPLTLLAAVPFSPALAEQLADPSRRLEALSLYFIVIGGAGLTLFGGDQVARLRAQIAASASIGRYRLRRRLAAGGMGEVWAAYHEGLRRDVAVKLIRAGAQTGHEVQRFEQEVRATAELTHPNTVRVFDYGVTADGVLYYAMELLEGEDLQKLVGREGGLPCHRALRLVTQAAQALGEAHARGIVHRDVKPANLLVQQAGSGTEYVKLIDFGIARRHDSHGMTQTGMVVGTPGYIAPEAITGAPADARSDVYALGAVLYFALVGRMPFEADTVQALVLAHVHADPPPPSTRAPHPVPPELDAIVLRCLAKDPMDRYANAEALASALLAVR